MTYQTLEPAVGDMLTRIKETFAEVTRYPLDILDENVNLEEDLGIDSVKLGEVFSVLRERYDLPEHIGIAPEKLKTIAGISSAISEYLGEKTPQTKATQGHNTSHIAPEPLKATAITTNLTPEVISIFEDVTRYPAEILDPAAKLEEDLGVDSVKLGEVFSVLRERFGLPEQLAIPPEQLQSISGITQALQQYLKTSTTTSGHQLQEDATLTNQTAPGFEELQPEPVAAQQLEQEILQVFAEVTRYPAEILEVNALLEEDLGIDSVKLGEVFSVLREKYGLPEHIGIEPEQLKSISGISQALANHLQVSIPIPHTSSNMNGEIAPELMDTSRAGSALVSATPHPTTNNGYQRAAPVNYRVYEKPFEGKVAFVSGSGRGLGKEIASYLASLGATVIVNSFHSRTLGEGTVQEIIANGGSAMHVWGSMANPDHVHKVFDEIDNTYGGLDFFIANASNGMLARLEDLTVEHWEKAYRTNVIGLHQGALRAVELMKRRGGGKIITLSSPASGGYVDYFGCMGTVKAAVESLTRSLAIEMAKYNIQVNCVSPGPVYGELLNKWPESERLIKQWEDNTAFERLCEAEDVSHFIAYLLGDEVKIFTGSVLVMDGGISSQGW